ncbi:lipoyl synthase [Cucumis melo var. makuwa]|uniref:Lipoyl synthase n=1 Tax=Cucumis melo var. makuwa TaxID=1194695 RepID=A0A5A7TFY7_CUCMM|nr:lipoyl synthase [Cucumis melo var. makuwa]TYK20301.1 lipoyl synthase [Cucumis melo var. makuwa]
MSAPSSTRIVDSLFNAHNPTTTTNPFDAASEFVTFFFPFLLPPFISSLTKVLHLNGVDYIILTSVDRDDIHNGGSGHFAQTVKAMKELKPEIMVECLTFDFRGNLKAVETLVHSGSSVKLTLQCPSKIGQGTVDKIPWMRCM